MTDVHTRLAFRSLGVLLVIGAVGCATRTAPPPLPTVVAYPEFMYPVVPRELAGSDDAVRVDRGWRFLQSGDTAAAEREFAAALRRRQAFYPARAGSGYVALARSDFEGALSAFDAVVSAAPAYVPGLVGRGQTLLALKRDGDALEVFEAALAADASLVDVQRRVDVLRFRSLQDVIEAGRGAAAAGRLDDAARAYERAIGASPESAFLYRELAVVERRQGNMDAALRHFQRASELESGDAASLTQIGEILEQRQDFAGAQAAYRRAADIEPTPELAARLAALAERERDAALPAEFRAIASAAQASRGDLAALIGVRLEDVLRSAPARQIVVTDTRGHWAAAWITQVAAAGVIEPFPNHTFQPRGPVRRADLAGAVNRLLTVMAASSPDLRPRLAERPKIADMAPAHLSYPAAAVAVASGMMPLLEGGRFEASRPVSGAEATEVIARLRRLADVRR